MNLNRSKQSRQRSEATKPSLPSFASVQIGLGVLFVLVLIVGTIRNPHFWLTADQRGDRMFREQKFAEAAKAYSDPWHIGVAQYRNGDFEAAAKTFARVPGADGAFDQGNAWLMHGKYDTAVESYDRALGFKPGWKEAGDNKVLALARKQMLEAAGRDADQEQTGQVKPDDIVFDQKSDDNKGKPIELNGGKLSDEELRATWLRHVQTTPGDFLRAKFAYQAAKGNGRVDEGKDGNGRVDGGKDGKASAP